MKNKIILGTAQMGLNYGINNLDGKVSKEECFKIFECAFENNINTLDSAEVYGNAHEIIGLFHKNFPKKIFKIITKLPKNNSVSFEKKVDSYLRSLNIEKIECLMFHSLDSFLKNQKNIYILQKLKEKKRINKIGVSVYSNNEIEFFMDRNDIDVIQLPFNLFDNINKRKDILIKAKKRGIEIHTRSIFLQGLFFKRNSDNNPIVKSLKNELLSLNNIIKKNNLTVSDLAINYVLKQKFIDMALIGVDSLHQLKKNLKSLSSNLDSCVFEEIDLIDINNPDLINPSLW